MTTASFIATTVTGQANLAAQIAQLQADIITAGNLDNATLDDLATVLTDATTATATAAALEAAHESILETAALPAQLAGGQPISVLLANFALLQTASQAEPLAFDTLNRLQRVVGNITAISPASGPLQTINTSSAYPPGYAYIETSGGQVITTSDGAPIYSEF